MSKNHSFDKHPLLASVTGSIRFNMMNDFMFKTVLQEKNHVLIGLICALLHLDESAIKSAIVQNPITPGEVIDDKTVILDVKVLLNNGALLDLEMQVVNKGNWIERSSFYLCRNYTSLKSGQGYLRVMPSYQIGFLGYTLFPESPEFYAVNMLMNKRTHQIYTDKLSISVVDLTKIDLATEEDRRYKIDQWAQLFKSTTWEEFKMLSIPETILEEVGETICKVSADEHMRQLLEAREDAIRNELDVQQLLDEAKKERDEVTAKLDAANTALADKDAELADKNNMLADANARIAELEKQLADKEADKKA